MSKPEITSILQQPWDELPEQVLCSNDNDIYGKFAFFLLNDYTFSKSGISKFLEVDNVINYLRTLINLAKRKFSSPSAESVLFLTCVNAKAGTDSSQWFAGVKREVVRACYQREMAAGEGGDNSVTPVNFHHFCEISAAYSKCGSPEAADRRLSALSLWWSAGRSSEASTPFSEPHYFALIQLSCSNRSPGHRWRT